jgi:trehalose/maltose hydrolase-like predicted phosphorylase
MAFRQRFSSSKDMDATQRPINQNGLDRVLRSPYIKQADVLQCFFSLKNISKEELKRNLNFMNPLLCMKAPFSMCTFHTSCFIRQDGHGLYFLLNNIPFRFR